jgi:hypothetical protein
MILEYLFNETDLQVFDLYSAYDQKIREYKSAAEIESNTDLGTSLSFPPGASKREKRRIITGRTITKGTQ